MMISRIPGNLLIRILCILTVLLMLTGCTSADEQSPTQETIPAETTAVTEAAETQVQAEPEGTVAAVSDATAPSETGEVAATDPEATGEILVTESTVPLETIAEETQLSPELLAAKEEKDALQAELEELSARQEKTKRNGIIAAVIAGVIFAAAVIFLYLWRRADSALKKARKKLHQLPANTQISQIKVGKAHGIGSRNSQQDSFSVSPEELYSQNGVLAVVADGMGGLENGDKASQTAVISAMESFYGIGGTGTDRLLQMLAVAKSSVDSMKTDIDGAECGTTLLMGLIQDGHFHFVSVGDSRICLYRGGALVHLNREHSYLFDQIRQAVNGEISLMDVCSGEKSGYITSYLGMKTLRHVDIPVSAIPLLPKDKVILMSDGIYNALTQEEICLALQHPAQDAADAIESFIHTKNFPDQDNYTVVILECR